VILDDILAVADRRAIEARARLDEFRSRAADGPPARSLTTALQRPGLSVIAEIKRRSPSAGVIDGRLDPVHRARAYEDGGCAAISVLTEPEFFDGSLGDLVAVRAAVDVPVLRKDFTRDPAQVWEARAFGADAVLLIVAALDDAALEACLAEAEVAGVDAIVEVHTAAEAHRAIAAGARIVGVNNRDLTTFTTDLTVAESVAPIIEGASVRIAESGVSDVDGAARMGAAGYDAILVGEALVRHADPSRFVEELRSAGTPS
jgi:indole-3-glycerol phosphate synthase